MIIKTPSILVNTLVLININTMNIKCVILGILFFLVMLISCTNKKKADAIQVFNIDMNSVTELKGSNLFSKIELIPLQTTETSLISKVRRIVITDEFVIISDNKNVITVFDKKGQYISNSKSRYGQGPEDYGIMMGFTFNEFSKSIEILTPKHLMCYDIEFNFRTKTELPVEQKVSEKKKGQYFSSIFALDKEKFILLPTTVSNEPHRVLFYNSNKQEISEISYADQVVSGLTQQVDNIHHFNDSVFSFSPLAFTYCFYTIDKNALELKKKFRFDFGKLQIQTTDLKQFKSEKEKADYLAFSSISPLPLRTFFNENFVVSHIRREKQYYTYFIFKKTNSELLVKNNIFDGDSRLPLFETLRNNVLYANININELYKFIDIDLLDKKSFLLLKELKPDDNPCIVKYYLK